MSEVGKQLPKGWEVKTINEVSKVRSGMFVGAVNLNEYDLQSVNARNWFFSIHEIKALIW